MSEKGSVLSSFDSKFYRVAIYLRLSDEDRNKVNKTDDSESIKNQRNLLVGEVSKHNDWVLFDEYCDEDLSGAGTYRPEFERLIEDCKSGKIDIVFCKSQSRFSRDMEVIEKYLHNKFIEWNIRFISFTDNADTSNAGNKKARQINGLVNEWYLEDLSNNIRTAFEVKMRNGEFISPFSSYGYEIDPSDNNKLIVDETARLVVKEIFDLYLKDYGFGKIAKILNDKNIPAPSLHKHLKGIKLNIISNRPINEIKWSHNAIKTILNNEIYIGNLIQGKRSTVSYKNRKVVKKDKNAWIRYENTHEAIIDKETWKSVQKRLKNRSRLCQKTGKIHIFSGKVYCLECGCHFKKNCTSKHEYLVCTSNRNGYDSCINKLSMRYDILEDIVLTELNKELNKFYDEDLLKDIEINKEEKDNKQNIINQIKKLQDKLKEKEKYFNILYNDRVEGIITLEQFKKLQDNYLKEIDNINKMISNLDNQINKVDEIKENKKDLFLKYKHIDKLNRTIVEEFIDRIEIGILKNKNRKINIKWKF